MNGLKTFGRVSASGLFKLSLLLFAAFLPLVLIFGTPNKLKSTLKASGIYDIVVDKALDSAAKNAGQDNSLPIDDPAVRTALKKALPPSQIQTWVEQLIDGTYGWLNSNDANPTFKLDFSGTKQNISDALGDYAVQRAQTLPTCTIQQLRALQASGGKIDAFQATCIPQGFDINTLRTTVQSQVLNNKDFLEKTTVSASDFPKNEQGKTVFETATPIRSGYKVLKVVPYILLGVALVSAISLVFLHDKRRRGIFVVGRTLVAVGTFITLSGLVVRYLISQTTSPNGPIVKQVQVDLQATVIYVTRNLGYSTNTIYLTIGISCLLGGVVLLLINRFTSKKEAIQAPDTTDDGKNDKHTANPTDLSLAPDNMQDAPVYDNPDTKD